MEADVVLVATGAGMGVDSGLPDFRGRDGFWRAYPALGRAGRVHIERDADGTIWVGGASVTCIQGQVAL